MTDTEIIKALECCSEHKRFCDGCTYKNKTVEYCDTDLCKDAVALIKRQKAEIDILIRKKDTLRDEIAEQKAEIERLQGIILAFMDEVAKLENDGVDVSRFPLIPICDEGRDAIERYSALAIKEFAKRLKTETFLAKEKGSVEHILWIDEIDKLVKEMTEQKE